MARGTGGARWRDNDTAYGWVSIILHWVVAVGVLTIWLIGDWMQGRSAESPGDLLQLHVSLAASLWLLAVVRIAWRLRSRHPRIGNPGPWRHLGIKLFHYLLLLALAVMLVSGPLMVWSGGEAVDIFGWLSLPSPTGSVAWLNQAARKVHFLFSDLVIVMVLLHICGAFKHLMFNDDETFIRMLIAQKPRQ